VKIFKKSLKFSEKVEIHKKKSRNSIKSIKSSEVLQKSKNNLFLDGDQIKLIRVDNFFWFLKLFM